MATATIMKASLNGMEKIQEMKRAPIRIKPVFITIEPMIMHWPDAICWFPVWDGIIGLPIVTWTIRACWIWICGFSFWDVISIATSSVASCLNGNDGLFRFIFFVDKYSLFKFHQTSEEMKIFGFFWIAIGRNRAQAPTCVKNCQTSKLYSLYSKINTQFELWNKNMLFSFSASSQLTRIWIFIG